MRTRDGAEEAYVALGSNLGDPVAHVLRALEELGELPSSRLLRRSRLFVTPPLGPRVQPDYVNAVAAIDTGLEPLCLLDLLQGIERAHGRRRNGERWGPRPLDLDLLLFGARVMDTERLRLPHPEMHRRAFVLVPLAEVAPVGLAIPGSGILGALLSRVDQTGMRPLRARA